MTAINSVIRRFAQAIVLGLLTFAGSAEASDPTPRPVSYCGGRFHGLYGGFSAGGVVDTTSWSDRDFWLTGTGYTHTQTGVAAGAQIGYNHQCGNMLMGVEADWSWTSVKSDQFYQAKQAELKYGLDSFGTVRGRIGIVNDPLLLYLTGGLAFGSHHQEFINVADHVGKMDATHLGFVIGAGAEWAINDRISLKSEALYVNLGTHEYLSHPRVGFGNLFKFDVTDDFWVGRVGLNIKLH